MKKKLSANQLRLKHRLDYHYRYFDLNKISPDPLEFLHLYDNYYDIEISGLLSSLFAYGNISQIQNSLKALHSIMQNQPYEFVKNFELKKHGKLFKEFKHRFYTGDDIAKLFEALRIVYDVYGSLKYLFILYHFSSDTNLKNSISFFSKNLRRLCSSEGNISSGMKFMFPDPFNGSACKRMNLFLRWMVRKDDLDFGLWTEIRPDQLIIPVDTHVAKICKKLKLTKHKNVSWRMAEEITESLKMFNSKDPVKYDFAICHIGIRKMKF